MPKVETSSLIKRGDINRLAAPQNTNCVSNYFGKYGKSGFKFNESRFGLVNCKQIQFRFKRSLDEPNLDVEHSLPKRRVVKKLIRIQPVYNQTLELENSNKEKPIMNPHSENSLSSSEEDYSASSTASRKHYRKRVVIKKRRKKRPKIVQPSMTQHRRKLVVTHKRLLTKTMEPEIPIASTVSNNQTMLSTKSTETMEESNNSETLTVLPDKGHVPEASNLPHEPIFPELPQSLDPIILLKTTVIKSVENETKTVVQNRLRTYTFVVTRVRGDEQIVTSTTEVKPQAKTLTVTEPRTRFTTLTLLDLEATETLPFVPLTVDSSSLGNTPHYTNTQEYNRRIFEEARYNNLATRIMSNGVEVIVAGDKSTLPGEPDIKRVLPSSIYKPITLKPSTLSDHMMMLLPQEASNVESLSSSLHPNQFVTKTCLTTFTYLTTYFENGTTTISSHEQVVSNIATEERNSATIIPTPSAGITLTQNPNLAVGTFMTTYTYLNTIMDGEQPLVVTSKHTVTNTVTAPDDYLSLMQPPKKASAVKDTNTYYSTISLEKTLYEGKESKIVSTNEIVTQVVITESVPQKSTSVMTSYIALDFEDNGNTLKEYSTTDVVKTYYVTYTYLDSVLENGQTVVKTNVTTSSDVVTEKLFLHPKRTHSNSVINTSPITKEKKKNKIEPIIKNLEIHATKTYVTTFTYFTTLLQDNKKDATSTVISSHTREVENVVTETIDLNLLDEQYLNSLQTELKGGKQKITVATLHNGQIMEITAINKDNINPTKVLPIEKTQMVETKITPPIIESSNPNIVTGSTIIFFDEIDKIDSSTKKPTPSLTTKPNKVTKTAIKNGLGSLLSSEIVKKSQEISSFKHPSKTQSKRHTNKQTRIPIAGSKSTHHGAATAIHHHGKNKTNNHVNDPAKKKTSNKVANPEVPDLLGLGSINMNTFHALKPVINAMAGLIQTNLQANRRNDSQTTTPAPNYQTTLLYIDKETSDSDTQNRSPIYIPLGADEEGLEIAESQNVATIHINEWENDQKRPHKDQVVIGKPTHESPLLNGGIPISPGQVITANSDVIVGKPGRIGPRIPSIPSNHDDIPVNMQPPPISKSWLKRHNDKFVDHLASASLRKEKPEMEIKNNDYYGPPPPISPPKIPLRPSNFVRGEKHKLVDRKRNPNNDLNRIPINFQNVEAPILQDNREAILHPNFHETSPVIITKQFDNIHIQPSMLNEPFVLPEVIERSTGQPLLVNLQPSQVAFVNIPHNRTTALIYGGSTEPHRNGQYFDDPSPYPEPEFSGIENFSNGIPQYASVYDDTQPPNQKQVGGVITVGTSVINNNPPAVPSNNHPEIRPSRPINANRNHNQQNVNVNIPPISFGMVHNANDFNAHIINHGDIQFSPPAASYEVYPNNDNQNVIPQGSVIHQQSNPLPRPYQEEHHGIYNGGVVHQQAIPISRPYQDEHTGVHNAGVVHHQSKPASRPYQEEHHGIHNGGLVQQQPSPGAKPYQEEHHGIHSNPGSRPYQEEHHGIHNGGLVQQQSRPYQQKHPGSVVRQPSQRPYQDEHPTVHNGGVLHPVPKPQQEEHPDVNIILPENYAQNRPVENLRPPNSGLGRPAQRPNIFHSHSGKHRVRPNQNSNSGLKEYLTPPQFNQFSHNRPDIPIRSEPQIPLDVHPPPPAPSHQQHHNYIPRPHIPINSEVGIGVPPPQNRPDISIRPEINYIGASTIPDIIPDYSIKNHVPIPIAPEHNIGIPINHHDMDYEVNDHREDDLANEAGEVIQESNPRPLRPGQIPAEVLRANLTNMQNHPSGFKNNTIRFPETHNVNFGIKVAGHDNEVHYHRPAIQDPRPFEVRPIVRPENQQTNQINQQEHALFVYSGNVRPENQQSNQIKFNDLFVGTQNLYDYADSSATTKQPQFYYEGFDNVNISFGQKIPDPSDYFPVKELDTNKDKIVPTTYKPLKTSHIIPTTRAPDKKFYDHTIGSVEIVPIDTNLDRRRPYITSMPVNPPGTTLKPALNIYEYAQNFGSQTEKPFNATLSKKPPHQLNVINTTYNFGNEDVISTQNIQDKSSTEPDFVTPSIHDTIFESTSLSTNMTSYESDLEIMKPPPPPEPATSMQPPKIEVHSPGEGIHRVPNLNLKPPIYDLESQASSPSPYVPQPMGEILPPKTPPIEEVMGLSPPPPVTTHRPILHFNPNASTHKPVFSIEIDPPRTPLHPYTFEIPTTTAAPTRRRRPNTRRPFTRRTTVATTTLQPAEVKINWNATPFRVNVFKRNITRSTTTEIPNEEASETEQKISSVVPSPSENKPPMEVIIGKPSSEPPTTEKSNLDIEIYGSEVFVSTGINHATQILETVSTTRPKISTELISTVTYSNDLVVPTSIVNFTAGVHHAGNEVKIVDDSSSTSVIISTPISSSKKSIPTQMYKESKIIIPTRYITHTKTSTVTITKTTVVKTLGGPPSTMTILVTKTEKSTIVDTVTEIHTLVQPTNIVETITTTINQVPTTLYPPDVPYGSTYSLYPPILPTSTHDPSTITPTSTIPIITEAPDDLEEFIIHDTDPPPKSKPNASIHIPTDNDSIFVVMTDQKHGEVIKIPEKNEEDAYEAQNRDEVPASNEVNRILLGGILIASPPSLESPDLAKPGRQDKCQPECKASKNELCQKIDGIMRCVCRPGFARMFPDRPCKPTYTYSIKLGLERHGKEKLRYEDPLADSNSPEFTQLASVTHEALDRTVMQSDLRDIYHGVHVHSFEPVLGDEGIINNFYLQLSDNTDEQRLKEIFKKYLRSNNFSLGGTELYASKDFLDNLAAEDFNECANPKFHDCSEYSHCFNLPGTYTCSCKEGYSDISENSLYPGRICSAELIGCEKCHYHGTCYSKGDDQIICECFQWYAGENCHINLKVLLIALVTLGTLLFALLLVCIIMTCARRKPRNAGLANGMSFMPQRLSNHNARRTTLDRRAMIQDTSSEGSQSDTNTLPYVAKKPKKLPKGALKKTTTINVDVENGSNTLSFSDQKDRSLPVMIPRAKYHPAPPTSPHLNMESFDKRKASASSNETKLLSYLDAGPSPNKVDAKRKYNKASNDSFQHEKSFKRKISGGALVSAGFEVSATVGGPMGTMGTIGTTYGTEADRSENATLIQKISADLLSSTGTRSQFTTFRKSLVDTDIDDPLANWLDIPPKVTATVSEARSYDETTIQAPTKSYRNGYDSKPSSQHQNDEANTMAERDVGSTFLLPHTHLYKPDRGSDISGFDSL